MKDFISAKERLLSLGNGISVIKNYVFGIFFTVFFWGFIFSSAIIFGPLVGAILSGTFVTLFIIMAL
jgi:hypothetical protein